MEAHLNTVIYADIRNCISLIERDAKILLESKSEVARETGKVMLEMMGDARLYLAAHVEVKP
jgi:hypothetical protein